MGTYALDERNDLVDSLRRAGPGAATLIDDWTTSQLAASSGAGAAHLARPRVGHDRAGEPRVTVRGSTIAV